MKMAVQPLPDRLNELPPAMALPQFVGLLLAASVGAFAAVVVLPAWLPGLSASLLGEEPKAYWYLSRASALMAFVLLWLSMGLGLLTTSKLARAWPGGPMAFDLHQHTSLLGIAFALFHALILLGDRYTQYSLLQILVPFGSTVYRPLWVGLGQLGFYVMALVGFSFYARRSIGYRAWRLVHFASFLTFALALAHGVLSGTDSGSLVVRGLYWVAGGSVLFLSVYRVLLLGPRETGRPAAAPVRAQPADGA
jgi:predicted ferric reductase